MISFVGAGPGAPDLITVRGARRLADARVVVWASSLVPEAVLGHCRPGAELHDSASMTLEDVVAVYAAHDDAAPIVRLHSGDPSIYGALGEQLDWCLAQGRSFEVVPGVSSLTAAAAALRSELTSPGVSQSIVITRLSGRTAASMGGGAPRNSQESVAAFAAHGATMAVFLSAARPDELGASLLAPGSGYTAGTPAAIVVKASRPEEVVVRTTAGRLADELRRCGSTMTVLVLVGEALAGGPVHRRSRLYEPGFTTAYRLRSDPGSTRGRPSARER